MDQTSARRAIQRFGRRRFVTATGGAAALTLLAACGDAGTSTPTPTLAAAQPTPTTVPAAAQVTPTLVPATAPAIPTTAPPTAQATPTPGPATSPPAPTPVPAVGTAGIAGPDRPLEVRRVERGPMEDGAERLLLHTDAGTITCRLHDAPGGDTAVLWVFGGGGGLGGPAGGLYPRLARPLAGDRVASLEVAYRRPRDLTACIADVLTGIGYLGALGRPRIALVGHSFGGSVVITAGAGSTAVIAVVALSSVNRGTEAAGRLSPRPLLLAHGVDDEIVPESASRDIYARAREPKRLILYPGCRHGLDECRDELDRDLLGWLREVTAGPR